LIGVSVSETAVLKGGELTIVCPKGAAEVFRPSSEMRFGTVNPSEGLWNR